MPSSLALGESNGGDSGEILEEIPARLFAGMNMAQP